MSVQAKSDLVFESLLGRIVSGELEAGSTLPSQKEMASQFGVTITSLREALKRLEQIGVVVARHGDATRVSDWRETGGVELLPALLFNGGEADPDVFAEVLDARTMVLTHVAARAAENREITHVERLVVVVEQIGSSSDLEELLALDFEFFNLIALASGNIVYRLILNSVRQVYIPNAEKVPVSATSAMLAEAYRAIVTAIDQRDREVASELTRQLTQAQAAFVLAQGAAT